MPQRRQLDPVLKGRIIGRLGAGKTQIEVSRALSVASKLHFQALVTWSRQHQHWTLDEWRNVLFTDESRFCLTNDSRRTIIWRERGTRFHPKKIVEKRPFCDGGVLVRAGIMFNGSTDLHIFAAGAVNAQSHRDEVLERHVQLCREHAWDALGRRVAAHQPPSRKLSTFRNALRQEWKQLPAELLNHLVEDMPRRCDTCVAIRSNHTPY
ncbi:hypothetical protein ANN_21221 [Periplaneta americana]|uniref:Transposable element Tcb1 transposase n=1 Tax=Periplaneta americana TaxID=6978 RepID=A0ABQ8SER1_PERAM|nr:hypothetical protein ANN_21221 [Periplaneta americana]